MSVIIRLQNLPWSANALDIRNFFRGLSIPEGGVHIVGGELGDAFIAFSTDEDARQAMMLDGGKIKEVQVKLHLSSRSEMHKVIEAARQSVPLLSMAAAPQVVPPAPAPPPPPAMPPPPPAPIMPTIITPFSAALGNTSISSFGIPGIGNPQEIPQPAVIELPPTQGSPTDNAFPEEDKEDDRLENKRREKDRRRSRTRSRSRDREKKDRKRDRRDRSRSRERRRRDRSRSRDNIRRDRKRERKDRSRSRERSPPRRSRDRRKSPSHSQEKEVPMRDLAQNNPNNPFGNPLNLPPQLHQMLQGNPIQNVPMPQDSPRFNDASVTEAMNKMQELVKKRNPNAFQGDQNGGRRDQQGPNNRGGMGRGQGFQRERRSRFAAEESRDCCVAIRNAPTHTSYGDVRRFFHFLIDKHGIKMINDNMGRRTGTIFVRFIESRSKHLALQRKNNELKGARVIVDDLDDEAYDGAVDSFLPYREDNDEDEANLLIPDMKERSKPITVLKLSDMPNYVKEHDIIKTFNDYSLMSITLKDCRITRTKIAFVQFAKAEEAKLVFERRERFAFGRRQVTITLVSDDDFEKEKAALIPKNEVIAVPHEEPPQEVAPPRDPRQRRQQLDNGSGTPGSQGQSPAQSQVPQGAPFFVQPFGQNPPFAAGPATGFPAATPFPAPQFGGFPGPGNVDPRTAASNWANRTSFSNQLEQMPPVPMQLPIQPKPSKNLDDEPLDCVLMKGLPSDATDRTIVNFLSDTGAVPARIHLMLDQNGMPSGDCFCEFRSTQEARLAAGKHGKNLEGSRVTVDIVPRSVVEEALEGPKQTENMIPQDTMMGNGPPQFFEPMSRGGYNNRGSFGRGRGSGGFERGGFERGGFNRGFNRGGFDSGRSFRSRGFRGGYEGRGRGRGGARGGGPRGEGGFENGSERSSAVEDDSALEDFGAPGCVVSMENVPFRATIDEIMHFFSEFELTQDDVIRRFNERGQPTGDARVAFRTPFDAQRAVKTRHMDNIHDRRINLNIL